MDGGSVFWWVAGGIVAVTVVVAVVLVVKLVRARRLLGSAGIPMSKKVLFWASIAYLISPVDLLPDPILLDDIGFLLVALRSLNKAGLRAGVGPAVRSAAGYAAARPRQRPEGPA
ncbi:MULTISPECIES: YkvA family protein [unclassified Kitasatospora]|uniref:YkvA family protein n=1 Tax=unclassified Kitasatospora TaxID=2633591 RepID=UPI00331E30AB